MRTTRLLPITLAALTLPLVLAGCGKSGDTAGPTAGEPVAKVAAPAGKAWTDVVSKTADGGYLVGNPNAPIKLLEYGSLSCPHCAKFAQDGFQPLMNDFVSTGRVNFEFRSFAIHQQDVPLTLLAACNGTEAFVPLVEQVYANFDAMNKPLENQAVIDKLTASDSLPPAQRFVAMADTIGYTQFFAERGLPVAKANACLADLNAAQAFANQSEKYGNDGINSTPTIFVNGNKLDEVSWTAVADALRAAGAR